MNTSFLRSRPAIFVTILLLVQGTAFYNLSHGEVVPLARPLSQFPSLIDRWTVAQEGEIDQDTKDTLRADDYLTRLYQDKSTGEVADLYVAFFKTQQTGQTPHSPKNCLPGSGWVPSSSQEADIAIPGMSAPIRVNEYIVAKGTTKAMVLYWYQSHGRVVANEYAAKVWVVVDSLRYHRSDTALVRVVVGIGDGGEQQAAKTATRFVQAFFTPLRAALPS